MGRYSPDTRVNRRNVLVNSPEEFDGLLNGDVFFWMDWFKVKANKTKKIIVWRDNPDWMIYVNIFGKSDVPMTANIYGDPQFTDIGTPVNEPTTMPRNTCPDNFRLPVYKIYMDGDYESESGIHAISTRIDIGLPNSGARHTSGLAHHPTQPDGSMIEVKNISDEDGAFNILISWEEILVSDLL